MAESAVQVQKVLAHPEGPRAPCLRTPPTGWSMGPPMLSPASGMPHPPMEQLVGKGESCAGLMLSSASAL